MEIRIFGNYTGAALYLLLHFNDGEWYFVSFFFIIIKARARRQHPRWCPRDPFILIAENERLQPSSITLNHSAHQTRDSRDGKVTTVLASSTLWAWGFVSSAPPWVPYVFPPPPSPHPVTGSLSGAEWVCSFLRKPFLGKEIEVWKILLFSPSQLPFCSNP